MEGDFDCSGGRFTAAAFRDLNARAKPKRQEHLEAILADGLHVGGDMFFSFEKSSNTEVVVRGAVSLISTEVGGDLYLEGNFDFAGEDAVSADGIIVAGTTFLNGLRTNGIVRFVQGDLKQGLYIDGAKFDAGGNYRNWSEDENSAVHDLGGPSCGIYAPDAKVGETFVWKKIEKISGAPTTTRFWLYLSGSRTSVIEDDERSWRELDRFDVTGCEYGSISDLNEDIRWRLAVLDRQYAVLNGNLLHNLAFGCTLIWHAIRGDTSTLPTLQEARKRFKPQPYIQFAKVLRRAGYENAANTVLTQLERSRTRYSDFGALRQLGRWWVDLSLRYGFSPFRPVLIVLGWALVSAIVFDVAYHNKESSRPRTISRSWLPLAVQAYNRLRPASLSMP